MTANEVYGATMTLRALLEKHREIAQALVRPESNDFRFAGLEAAENPRRWR